MHRNTTECECGGHVFTAADVGPPLLSQEQALGTNDVHLFGGNVKRFAKAQCPRCGREYLLWLKPHSGSYRVLTISDAEREEDAEGKPLDELSLRTLRLMARDRGIKNYVKYSKAELVELLKGE